MLPFGQITAVLRFFFFENISMTYTTSNTYDDKQAVYQTICRTSVRSNDR